MDRRVFVIAPSGKDAALISTALERSGFVVHNCAGVAEAIVAADEGIGLLLVAEEALGQGGMHALQRFVERQPSWSDLPLLLLTLRGVRLSELASQAVKDLGNVTVLERPTQIATLVSAVATGLRARERQYDMRRADARKDMFLATLAHELRNPLAPLSNALHLLNAAGLAGEQQRRATAIMQRQIAHLSHLVDDLLDVARITRGKITLRVERFDLREAVHAGIETSLPQLESMGHLLAIDLPPDPVWVDGDRTRLAQCVSNLLTNAAKYTPQRGRIEISTPVQAQEVEIRVRDSGIGFRPQEARRIFEVFSQVDHALPRAQGGLGLGLAIVKALVELHGGSVLARSEGEGRGAVFSLFLARAGAPARPEAPEPAPAEPDAAACAVACRLLVVDDNRDSADSMAEVLTVLGHEVRTAYDGTAGLARLDDGWLPQLALLDIGLPDMSGHALAGHIRRRLGERCPVLVALTGWGQAIDVARSAAAGFDHHLTKPADIESLVALVEAAARARAPAPVVDVPPQPAR